MGSAPLLWPSFLADTLPMLRYRLLRLSPSFRVIPALLTILMSVGTCFRRRAGDFV